MLHNSGTSADATVIGAVARYSVGENVAGCSGAWNGAGSCVAGSNSDLSTLGGHESWGNAGATDAGNCAGPVWQVLAPAECPDFFKWALNLGRTCSMRSRGRLSSPQWREIWAAVAVAHENSPQSGIDLPSPCSPPPHDAADDSAAADGPACVEIGVTST
jgi:hypothetical protein